MLHATDALQCLSLHTAACRHVRWIVLANYMGSILSVMVSTLSLKMIRRPVRPPLLMGCSRVLASSSEHCLIAGMLERCLLLAPIPLPASILDKRCASRASLFCGASLICHARIDREAPDLLGKSVLRLCPGLSHLRGHNPSVVRLVSFVAPLC